MDYGFSRPKELYVLVRTGINANENGNEKRRINRFGTFAQMLIRRGVNIYALATEVSKPNLCQERGKFPTREGLGTLPEERKFFRCNGIPNDFRVFSPTASFNSLSNALVLKGVVTSRSWLT